MSQPLSLFLGPPDVWNQSQEKPPGVFHSNSTTSASSTQSGAPSPHSSPTLTSRTPADSDPTKPGSSSGALAWLVPPDRDGCPPLVHPPGLDGSHDAAEPAADDFAGPLRLAPDARPFKLTPQAMAGRAAWLPMSEYVPDAQDWSAGWTDVMRAIYEQVPLNEAGEPSSIGSITHETGTCRPCLFFFQASCAKGLSCTYCHLQHCGMKKKRIRMSKKVREMQAMMEAMAINPHARDLNDTPHGDWAAPPQRGAWCYSPQDWQSL